jgi:hypothetical protein
MNKLGSFVWVLRRYRLYAIIALWNVVSLMPKLVNRQIVASNLAVFLC